MVRIIVALLLGIVVCARPYSAATAGDSKADIAEHMYFARTSDATQLTPERAAFQDEMKGREVVMRKELHDMRLRDALQQRTSGENYQYGDAIEKLEAVINGLTMEKQVMAWMGAPLEVVTNEIIPWNMTSGRIAYHISRNFYPAPASNQKVIAKKYYYKEANTPREGLSLEVLFTVNKDTGSVEHHALYFGTGDIVPLWKANVITSG